MLCTSLFKEGSHYPDSKVCQAIYVAIYFRPISILPLLSEVFEKLVARHWILPFIRDKVQNTRYAYLSGPGSGTVCALTLMYNRIVHFLDRPGAVRVVSIDFAKAFDKVTHHAIIDACIRFQLPFLVINWITSFLSQRRQCVRIGEKFSTLSPISSGVPQGSVLGPLLFCLVVDDIRTVCSNSLCIKYADDITILNFIRSSTEDQMQIEWNNVASWARKHDLPINLKKSCVMDIITKKDISLHPIAVSDDHVLDNVSFVKILGVTFTDNMKWNMHVDNIVSKASRKLYILYNLVRSKCPADVLLQVYNECIRSTILYAYPVFCNCSGRLPSEQTCVH